MDLNRILESLAQPIIAIPANPIAMGGDVANMTQAEKEKLARQAGFPSYEAWRVWTENAARKTGGTVSGGGKSGKESKPKGKPQQQSRGGVFGWTDTVSRALGGK